MEYEAKLKTLGIDSQQVLSFFASFVKQAETEPDNILAPANVRNETARTDVSSDNLYPDYFWQAGDGHPLLIRNLFFFHSRLEAACFVHCHRHFLVKQDQFVMVALGSFISMAVVKLFLERYPNAAVHTVFPADPVGAVVDCRIGLCREGIDGKFYFSAEKVLFVNQKKSYEFEAHRFSLQTLQRRLGRRFLIQVHKPRGGHHSFYQLLQAHRVA